MTRPTLATLLPEPTTSRSARIALGLLVAAVLLAAAAITLPVNDQLSEAAGLVVVALLLVALTFTGGAVATDDRAQRAVTADIAATYGVAIDAHQVPLAPGASSTIPLTDGRRATLTFTDRDTPVTVSFAGTALQPTTV